jgi:DNA-binding transcriptional regulator YiaG
MGNAEKKQETFVYEGLGFPVELIDCPMEKIMGEWVLDINLAALQRFVFQGLIHKPHPLTGKELRFMRKFLEMSTTEFGEKVGVSHAAVVKWEKGQAQMSPAQESYIRLFLCECFSDRELLRIYREIRPEMLAKAEHEEKPALYQIHVKDFQAANF